MIHVDIRVSGWKEVSSALRELGSRIAGKVIRQGLASGATVVRRVFREAAPARIKGYLGPKKIAKAGGERSPGFLKKKIGYYRKRNDKSGYCTYRIGPKRDAFYGRLVETGHAAGKRKKYGLHITAATGLKMVQAHPWMGPSFSSVSDVVAGTVKARMWRGIREEAEKLALKAKGTM